MSSFSSPPPGRGRVAVLSFPCLLPSPSSSVPPPVLLQLEFLLASLATARTWFGLELPQAQSLKDGQRPPTLPAPRQGRHIARAQAPFQERPQDHPSSGMEARKNRCKNRGENAAPMAVHGTFWGSVFVFRVPRFLCRSC